MSENTCLCFLQYLCALRNYICSHWCSLVNFVHLCSQSCCSLLQVLCERHSLSGLALEILAYVSTTTSTRVVRWLFYIIHTLKKLRKLRCQMVRGLWFHPVSPFYQWSDDFRWGRTGVVAGGDDAGHDAGHDAFRAAAVFCSPCGLCAEPGVGFTAGFRRKSWDGHGKSQRSSAFHIFFPSL
jgi:hypothetical protein